MKYARRALLESWTILATWCIFCVVVLMVCAPAYRGPAGPLADSAAETPAPDAVITDAAVPETGALETGASAEDGVSAAATIETNSPLVPTIGGLPRWVFWGIAVPWLAATVLTICFALGVIEADPQATELERDV